VRGVKRSRIKAADNDNGRPTQKMLAAMDDVQEACGFDPESGEYSDEMRRDNTEIARRLRSFAKRM